MSCPCYSSAMKWPGVEGDGELGDALCPLTPDHQREAVKRANLGVMNVGELSGPVPHELQHLGELVLYLAWAEKYSWYWLRGKG